MQLRHWLTLSHRITVRVTDVCKSCNDRGLLNELLTGERPLEYTCLQSLEHATFVAMQKVTIWRKLHETEIER